MATRTPPHPPTRRRGRAWSMLAAGAVVGLSATAQTAPAPGAAASAPAADAASPDPQRIEITAGKRRQLQSEVAGTVTAIGGARLEQLGAVNAEDVFKLSPGVQFNKGNADGALYSIRGIGTNTSSDNLIFGQAPTGIYIEDIPFTDPYVFISSPDVAPFDLERVEVLRGPQGALYGSSSLGGAVRYLFTKPDLRSTQFSALGGLSRVSEGGTGHTLSAMANLPLATDTAALRFVVTRRRDAGFVDNLQSGRQDVNAADADSARLLLGLRPTPTLDITALYLTQKSTQDGSGAVTPDPDTLTARAPTDAAIDSRFDLGSLTVNWAVSGLKLTSLTGYQTKRRDQRSDLTYLLVPDFTLYGGVFYPDVDRALNVEPRRSNSFTQEFRLAPEAPGALTWLVGAFHQKVNFFRSQRVTLPGANDPEFLPDDIYFDTVRRGSATENSLFADLDWKLTPQWSAGAGARYFRTEVEFERSNFGAPFTTFTTFEQGSTPRFSTRYQFSPEVAAYATASRGYRFGGINTVGSLPYRSDALWNYEAGLRLQPARNLAVGLSAFTLDWKDIQVSSANADGFILITNVARARSNGLEATVGWRPDAAFSLNGALAWTDATIQAPFTSASGIVVASGTRLPGVARLQASADATWRFAGPGDSAASLSAVLQHTGSRTAQLDADLVLPGYSTVDLRLAFAWKDVEATFYVQNLADSRGQSSAAVNYATYLNPGTVNYTEWYPIRPRTVGVTLRYDY